MVGVFLTAAAAAAAAVAVAATAAAAVAATAVAATTVAAAAVVVAAAAEVNADAVFQVRICSFTCRHTTQATDRRLFQQSSHKSIKFHFTAVTQPGSNVLSPALEPGACSTGAPRHILRRKNTVMIHRTEAHCDITLCMKGAL